jgi:hypothetical protein
MLTDCVTFYSPDSFYVTWGARHNLGAWTAPGQSLPPHGKPLGKLSSSGLKNVIKKVSWEPRLDEIRV